MNDLEEEEESINAKILDSNSKFDVKLIILVVLFLLFVGMTGGTTDGFNAIKPHLISSGVYSNLCPNTTMEYFSNSTSIPVCVQQDLRLNLMYIICINVNLCIYFLFGFLVDHFHRKVVFLVGLVFLCIGFTGFGLSNSVYLDLYIPSYIMIGIGGNTMYVLALTFVNETDRFKGIINGLSSSAFSLSSCVYLIFSIILDFKLISIRWIFVAYSILVAIIGLFFITILPKQTYHSNTSLIDSIKAVIPWRHFLNWEFVIIALGFSSQFVSNTFYMSTLLEQLGNISKSNEIANYYTDVFSTILPIVGVIASIGLGYLCDHITNRSVFILHAMLTVLHCLFSILPNIQLQIFTFVFFLVKNYLTYIGIANLCFRKYQEEISSRMFTLFMTIAGVFGFTTYLLNYLVYAVFDGKFLIINVCLGITCTFGSLLLGIFG